MALYRKKPVVIEAMQWDGLNAAELLKWVDGSYLDGASGQFIKIPTLEGVMAASVGDYVIRGVAGEFYPCKDEIFRATYEAVTDGAS